MSQNCRSDGESDIEQPRDTLPVPDPKPSKAHNLGVIYSKYLEWQFFGMGSQCLSQCPLKGKKVLGPKLVMKKLEKKKVVRKHVVKRVSPNMKALNSFLVIIRQHFLAVMPTNLAISITISITSCYPSSPVGSARDDHAIWRLLSCKRSSEEGQAAQPPSCHVLRYVVHS